MWLLIPSLERRPLDSLDHGNHNQKATVFLSLYFRIRNRLQYELAKATDRVLDRLLGVRTDFIQTPVANTTEVDVLAHAKRYQPSGFLSVVRVLRLVRHRYPTETFIDLGCGAGRVLVLASCTGFRSLIGVDIDPGLLESARANFDTFRRRFRVKSQLELQNVSASRFQIPHVDSSIFLFNPFDPVVMEQFMEFNRERMQAVQVTFVCINPRVGEVLERFGFQAVCEWPHAEFARIVRVYRRRRDGQDPLGLIVK
jgi:SAM-dependent methyltransferase